jgi:hypothetical protein
MTTWKNIMTKIYYENIQAFSDGSSVHAEKLADFGYPSLFSCTHYFIALVVFPILIRRPPTYRWLGKATPKF